MPTVFTRIIDGELPGTFVWRDDRAVAIMSINPLRKGHVLVVPRDEVDRWYATPPELVSHLFAVAREIAVAQQEAFQPTRIGLMIAGLEVPHLHIHLVPIDRSSDLDFANAAITVDRDELEDAAEAIRYVLTANGAAGVSH